MVTLLFYYSPINWTKWEESVEVKPKLNVNQDHKIPKLLIKKNFSEVFILVLLYFVKMFEYKYVYLPVIESSWKWGLS